MLMLWSRFVSGLVIFFKHFDFIFLCFFISFTCLCMWSPYETVGLIDRLETRSRSSQHSKSKRSEPEVFLAASPLVSSAFGRTKLVQREKNLWYPGYGCWSSENKLPPVKIFTKSRIEFTWRKTDNAFKEFNSEVRHFAALFSIQFLGFSKTKERENIRNFIQTFYWIIQPTMIEYPGCLFSGF